MSERGPGPMKSIDLEKTLPIYPTYVNQSAQAMNCQRCQDAETICSRLSSLEELEKHLLSLPKSLTLLDVISEVHTYYKRRLKGETDADRA